MALKIDQDHARFRDIVKGRIRQNLRKYISQGEMIARKGNDKVAIPLPSVDIPHFKFGDKQSGGVGQGELPIQRPAQFTAHKRRQDMFSQRARQRRPARQRLVFALCRQADGRSDCQLRHVVAVIERFAAASEP